MGQQLGQDVQRSEIGLQRPTKEGGAIPRDVPARKQRSVHRIEALIGIIDHEAVVRRIYHVRREPVAFGEVRPAQGCEPIVPLGDAGVQRCLRLQHQYPGTGRCDGIGGGGIAAGACAVEQHLVKLVEKPVVVELIKEAGDQWIAEPSVAVAEHRKRRPSLVSHHVKPKRCAGFRQGLDPGHGFEADQQRVAVLDKDTGMAFSEGFGKAVLFSQSAQRCKPGAAAQVAEVRRKVRIARHAFDPLPPCSDGWLTKCKGVGAEM